MLRFLELMMIGLVALSCLLVGSLPASGALEGGPLAVIVWGLITAAVVGLFIGWLTRSLMFSSESGMLWGFVAALLTVLPSAFVLLTGSGTATHMRDMAPKVESFATARFAELDANHNNEISDEEMGAALSKLSLTAEERRALEHMRSEQSQIGHVIDSYDTTTYIWTPIGTDGAGYFNPVTTTTYIYAISLQDLKAYPEKVTRKYQSW